jgi:hypothetical protein
MSVVFSYGGGRQTVAMCILVAKGVLPKPDVVVMADTGRENQSTWDYLKAYTRPLLKTLGLDVEIASHDLATVDIYSGNGDLLLPAFTQTGKLIGFCSNEWKKRVCDRHLRATGRTQGTRWLGLAFDEKRRWVDLHNRQEGKWKVVCPLVDLMLNTDACLTIIENFGWPLPMTSSCWMCPHKRNAQWRHLRNNYPEQWQQAIQLDREIRENDERGGVFVHHSRVPLDKADISYDESPTVERKCSLGMCFV